MNFRTIVVVIVVVAILGFGLYWYKGGVNYIPNGVQSPSTESSSETAVGTPTVTSSDPLISKLYQESVEERTNFNTDAADTSFMTSDDSALQNLNQAYDETKL